MVDNKENDKFDLGVKGLIRYLFLSSNKRERFQLKGPLNLMGLTLRYRPLNRTILEHILPERYNNITLSSIFFSIGHFQEVIYSPNSLSRNTSLNLPSISNQIRQAN